MEHTPKSTEAGTETPDFEWAKDYHPWKLIFEACVAMGLRAAILIFVYIQICPWNPKWHLVAMHCSPETTGQILAYPCEGTKAFVRSFPLLAASLSLITIERFIVQRRLYYHLLAKRALLDYTNYHPENDSGFRIVVCCFSCCMLHFVMDLAMPPYVFGWVTFEKLQDIGNIYVMPCLLFIFLYHKFLDIEKHLVPLARFYDEDPDWAKRHLAGSELYSDLVIRDNTRIVRQKFSESRGPEGTYTLDEFIDETLAISETHGENVVHSGSSDAVEKKRRGMSHLFKGLWPGEVLLDQRLTDEESAAFRRAFQLFRIGFFGVQLVVLYLIVGNAYQETLDVVYTAVPSWEQVIVFGEQQYQMVGAGYCRDESMQRPDGYFRSHETMDIIETPALSMIGHAARLQGPVSLISHESRLRARSQRALLPDWMNPATSASESQREEYKLACAAHCSGDVDCIGFTEDVFFCTIYDRKSVGAPAGWTGFSEKQDRTASVRRLATVAQGNGSPGAKCWRKLSKEGQPQDIAGLIVYLGHFALIVWIIYKSYRKY